MTHTPTPWEHDKQSDCILDAGGRVIVSPYESEHNIEADTANIGHIVKTVNSYDQMVKLLNAVLDEDYSSTALWCEIAGMLKRLGEEP